MNDSTSYDDAFFDYVTRSASRSASVITPILHEVLEIRSVLDVGCGLGAWLKFWGALGIDDCMGLDGPHVDHSALLMDSNSFLVRDLVGPFHLDRKFDLVQCLEVAEHLPASSSESLIHSIVQHSEVVLFSAAPPGQGGHGHINEQPYEYWRKLFAAHQFMPYDFLRPMIFHSDEVDSWYRYNCFLYIKEDRCKSIPPAVQSTRVPDEKCMADISPQYYKIRKHVLRHLSPGAMTMIAKVKERLTTR